MKKIIIYSLIIGLTALNLSCSLDEDPLSDFSEVTVGGSDTTGSTVKYLTRAEMLTQYEALYNQLKGNAGLENWNLDMLVYTETHADNSYRGAIDQELEQLERQRQNGVNKNIERDWNNYLGIISQANQVIVFIDSVPDQTLTQQERQRWKAEALVLRAWIMFDMVRLWGDIPMVLTEPPAITAANIEQVYHLYFPPRNPAADVYSQIISDLETALLPGGVPPINPSNKFLFSRTVAHALLAKVYAEQPVRDYNKVIEYCELVEPDVSLVNSYSDLFAVNDSKTDAKLRHSSESIFEIPFSDGGNWNTWMFGVDESDPNSRYDWAKWITPSRDLLAAYDREGDIIRKNISVIQAEVTWSNHYPSDAYWHMHKFPSKFNSIIKLRLADILLLKAEAYVGLGNLAEAADIVRTIRARVSLPPLSASVTGSQEAMLDAVLNERRLELAFEGQRWFDLVRTGKVFTIINSLNSRDPGRSAMSRVTEQTVLLPLPQSELDKNPSLVQNPGY